MSRFLENSESNTLRMDIDYISRRVHHALDNYGMDMDKGLVEELQELEKALYIVSQRLGGDKGV